MRFIISLICMIVIVNFSKCSKDHSIITSNNSVDQPGNVSLSLNMDNTPSSISNIEATLSREGYDTLMMLLSISGNNASGTFYDIPSGSWDLTVSAIDSSGNILYTGSTLVEINNGETTIVNLYMQPTNGNIEIHVTWGNNSAGNAISLDGDGDYIRIPYNSNYRPTNAITVETWFKLYNPINQDQCFRILSSAHAGGWSFRYNNKHFIECDDGRLGFSINIEGTYYRPDLDSLQTLELPANEWIHIAGTYDNEYVRFYINGNLIDTVRVSGKIHYEYNNAFLIGADAGYGDYPDIYGPFYFNGEIDEVRIWDRARTMDEINSSMSSILTGYEKGLVGYWRFDNSTQDTVYDYSGNNNVGYFVGDVEFVPSGAF